MKDRHNGNILLDSSGHVIHIDYGFMLSNSPGNNWNFENVPFKLTREHIDVMGGEQADMFHYFRLLVIRGFLEVRLHAPRFMTLLKPLIHDSAMPCFIAGPDCIQQMAKRFCLESSEEECMNIMNSLIDESCDHWRSRSYDEFQKV